MERGTKRVRKSVSLLGLEDWVPIRDVRNLIWDQLNPIDKLMVWSAHGIHTYLERELYWFRIELVKYGYLELLLWHTDGEKDIVTKSIYLGEATHLHMIKWIAENDPDHFDTITITEFAAFQGNLDILKYIKSLGLPFNEDTVVWGAKGGHIEIVKWWKEEMGLELNVGHCISYNAVDGDHVELLKWCLDNIGCHSLLLRICCFTNKLNAIKVLANYACYFNREEALSHAIKGSEIETWLLRNT